MKRMPDTNQLTIAISWLRCNEGAGGEAEACTAVADWVEHQESERYLRYAARQAGVPIARLRKEVQARAFQNAAGEGKQDAPP